MVSRVSKDSKVSKVCRVLGFLGHGWDMELNKNQKILNSKSLVDNSDLTLQSVLPSHLQWLRFYRLTSGNMKLPFVNIDAKSIITSELLVSTGCKRQNCWIISLTTFRIICKFPYKVANCKWPEWCLSPTFHMGIRHIYHTPYFIFKVIAAKILLIF